MEKVPSSRRRDKHAESLEDSASASGRILSYQRLHSDTSPKSAGKTGKCAETSRVPIYSSRAKQRIRADPQHRHSTPRSAHSNAGNTIRPRLSSTSLHQIHHEHNQHPNFLDHHERTRQWLDSAEHPAAIVPPSQLASAPEATTARFQAMQQKQQRRHVQKSQPSTGCFSFLSCFRPQTVELKPSAVVETDSNRPQTAVGQ